MKLSKSKLALAKVINDNGGWFGDAANAAQDKEGDVNFYNRTPRRIAGRDWWSADGVIDGSRIGYDDGAIKNWHQTVLSREEYYQEYPKADADGWIEWKGGECPVDDDSLVDVRFPDGSEYFNTDSDWDWSNTSDTPISHYRPSKKDVKPEFCESVTRSIPDPEAKSTIEQLAKDYRNRLYFANRKQQEADDARAAADVALGKLERAGEEIGLLIGIHKDGSVVDYLGWNSWVAGDLVELVNHQGGMAKVGEIGPISKVVGGGDFCVDFPSQLGYSVEHSDVKFIRRP